MRAEIVSCGTELLLGQISDTNATYLAQSLSSLGIDLFFVPQVGDNRERLVDTLQSMGIKDHTRDQRDVRLHYLFEEQVMRTPQAVAVVLDGTQLTYHALDQQATHLAHQLRALGVGPEIPVGVYLERSPGLAVGLLAVLKAGGVYVPLDPSSPVGRVCEIVSGARITIILSQRELRSRVEGVGARILSLNEEEPSPGLADRGNPGCDVLDDPLAYIVYTSGTSGTPKGVLIPHRASVCHNTAVAQAFGLCPSDRVLQFASPAFDVSLEELFATWAVGATVVFVRNARLTCSALLDVIVQERLTVLNLPGSFFHAWVAELIASRRSLPACLRLIVVGSEEILPQRLAQWLQLADPAGIRTLCAYGTCETAVTSTVYALEPGDERWRERVPIGHPLAHAEIVLLDDALRPVPQGVVGKLYIGGDGLARGYLNSPDQTSERFIPHPWSEETGARLYRTGDLASRLPDGTLVFAGRADRQVKLRGYRIEPAEVEAALLRQEGVAEAVVTLREDVPGDPRLVAYVVGLPGQAPSRVALLVGLRAALPPYKVPTIVLLEDLPRVPGGKLDLRALPVPESPDPRRRESSDAPRTPNEARMARIMAEVLGLERVGRSENFFDLGGQSLLAMQVCARLRSALGVEVPVSALFEAPTPARFASILEQANERGAARGPGTRQPSITPIPRVAQQWTPANHLQPGSPLQNLQR